MQGYAKAVYRNLIAGVRSNQDALPLGSWQTEHPSIICRLSLKPQAQSDE